MLEGEDVGEVWRVMSRSGDMAVWDREDKMGQSKRCLTRKGVSILQCEKERGIRWVRR